MLTSYPNLDSTFCSPVARTSPSSSAATGLSQPFFFQLSAERQREWLGACIKSCTEDHNFWRTPDHRRDPAAKKPPKKAAIMEKRITPDDDLSILSRNVRLLELCGYYYGNLSWMDASHILKQSKVGTFLVRDSEHHSYLYALSVQTKRGPTSCRIEYLNGLFRLDSSEELADKMPRFNTVPDLIDHYIHLTKNLPRKNSCTEMTPVWLDMDEENLDVPVQIYNPLYRNVRRLEHLCRVCLVESLGKSPNENNSSDSNSRTIHKCDLTSILPSVLVNYLKEYPYPQ